MAKEVVANVMVKRREKPSGSMTASVVHSVGADGISILVRDYDMQRPLERYVLKSASGGRLVFEREDKPQGE